ncbi:MAG: class I SAM-dependent methyltransferase [Thermodesulfobacteriota bacterium]
MNRLKELERRLEKARDIDDIAEFTRTKKLHTELSQFDKYRIKLMRRVFNKSLSGIVLDTGCSIGEMVKYYERRSSKSICCDMDLFLIRGTRYVNKNLPKSSFICADIRNLPFQNAYFDTIIALEIIEHLPKCDHERVINEILRVAKPDAVIYISTPNRFSLSGVEGKLIKIFVRDYKWSAWDSSHKYIYSSREFIRFTASKNLHIKNIYGFYFLPGSTLVRLPAILQRILGTFSFFISRSFGCFFPLKYLGFSTILELKNSN